MVFDAAGGSPVPEAQQVQSGGKLQKPDDPAYGDREFLGWFEYGAETAWDFDWDTVAGGMTLTARWSEPSKAALEIDVTPQEADYGTDPSFQVKAQTAEGFTVRYLQKGQEVTPWNAGSYDVHITRLEDETYAAVDRTVPGGLVVRPREAELSWTGGEIRPYSGQPAAVTAKVKNLLPEDQCTVTVEGGAEKDAGVYTACAAALSNTNYVLPQENTLEYTIRPAQVTPALGDNRLAYNGQKQEAALQIAVEGGLALPEESYTVEYRQEDQAVEPKAPGTYQVIFTLVDGNFTFSQEGEDAFRLLGDLTIVAERYPFDIRWPGALSLTYGDKLSQCALENGQEKNGAFSWKRPDTVPQAGEDQRFLAVFHPVDSAYPAVEKELEVSVLPKEVTVTLQGEKRYGEAPVALSLEEGGIQGMVAGETDPALLGDLRFSSGGNSREAAVGRYDITVTQTTVTNYRVVTEVLENAFEVKPAVHILEGEMTYEKTVGAAPFVLDLKSSAGADVTYQLSQGDAVTVTPEGEVTVMKSGTAKITAKAEKDNYETAQTVVTVHVEKDTLLRLLPPADIGPTGAVLRGRVESGGACTAALAYRKAGAQEWVAGTVIQMGSEEIQDLSYPLTGLEPGTVYEARLCAASQEQVLRFRTASEENGGQMAGILTGSTETAWVTVTAGGVVLASVPADESGNFALPGLPDGVYQLAAEDGAHQTTGVLEIQNGRPQGELRLALGQGDNWVEISGECLAAVDGLGALADDSKGCLTFQAVPAGEELSRDTQAKVLPLAGEQELGPVLECRLFWSTGEQLAELSQPLTFWLPLTGEMRSASGFQVYRIHNGAAECVGELSGESVTQVGDLLEIKSRRFSAYVVGYTLEKEQGPAASDGGTSGGGETEEPPEPEHLCKKYTDTAGHWAQEAICTVTELGLFSGLTESAFGPQATMTRAMSVTVLWRLAGRPAGDGENFADADPESWYAPAAAWAREREILQGVGQNRFDPHRAVTRQELAVFLFRYNGEKMEEKDYLLAQFEDGEAVAPWAWDAMLWAVDQGLYQGNSGRLEPERAVTRAEVAQILARYLENE